MKTFYLKTFGCVQNTADSERVKTYFYEQGMNETADFKNCDTVVINTCIIRESAENRAYGLIDKAFKLRKKIIVTGCLVGAAIRNKKINDLKKRFPQVDEFLPIESIGFDWEPIRDKKKAGLITISSGCNNYCSYCIVPFARGKEISRPMEDLLTEADRLAASGFKEIILIGQNVNSYGADLTTDSYVSMGKKRFKSLFPRLLESVAQKAFDKIFFISSNPWDFSDELIEVIKNNKNIDRLLHLPIQSGNDEILKKMNRSYTTEEYLALINKIRQQIPDVRISTDIIIGFPGETEEIFNKSLEVYKKANFEIAYLNKYSPRPGTVSAKLYKNNVPQSEKKRRWLILNDLINNRGLNVDKNEVDQ